MKDKVVLITGATSMIGRACAKLFSQNGVKLMLAGRSLQKLEDLANELTSPVELCITDFRSENDVQSMLEKTISSFQRLDGVIQNVAVYPWKRIEELTLSEWNETINTNLTSAFLTTQACFKVMQQQRAGKIVFISSVAGESMGLPYMSAYATSKAGINGFMRTAAIEFAPHNINVNCISPGKVFDPHTLTEEEQKLKLKPVPLKRFIQPIDIAEMALFIVSDKANNITGQNFIIDGGQSTLGEESHVQVFEG